MKLGVLVAIIFVASPVARAEQAPRQRSAQIQPTASDKTAQAYEQFLRAHYLEDQDNIDGAIAAFKRAMELDPGAAEIPAELAALYMQQNRVQEAIDSAEQALKIGPGNREAHRVLGIVYAALAENSRGNGSRSQHGDSIDPNVTKAIEHLNEASDGPGEIDPNVRATLARLYIRAGSFEKAIPLLTDLVRQEPGWQEGPELLVEAYAGAGRNQEAIEWLKEAAPEDPELYPVLADFYERQREWKEAADAYGKAVERAPRSVDLKMRYASALLNSGGRDAAGKAQAVLNEVLAARPSETRALYLRSQAQRRLGDLNGAEETARRVIAQNGKSPWGYYALAEALEERRQYQKVIDALTPVINDFRSRSASDSLELTLLLPHLGFAYQEMGQFDKATAAFEEAHKIAPKDGAVTAYLIQAHLASKQYAEALELAKQAHADHPDDLRFARLEAQALRHSGQPDEGIAVLEAAVKQHADDPLAYVALAQLYSDTDRGQQAVKVLEDAGTKFPADTNIAFELGAVFDKQKRFADAEAAFRQILAREPDNAPALNYLGYMLAERGERLDESVGYLKKALQLEPENGSYLDSLGWAYFKEDKLDLAEENLKRAADQLKMNSVVQDHYGDLLFKLGRYDEAISAWTHALAGDGESINRAAIDKKIRDARQKLGKK